MPQYISHSAEETERFGEQLAREAREGDIFALSGDLGAGKTALVRGMVRGLDCQARVHSPTYSLINIYSGGKLPVYHLDLYRLGGAAEAADAGLEEYLNGAGGVALVEWADRWIFPAAASGRVRRIHLAAAADNVREINYDGSGS